MSESSRWFVKALYSMDHVVRLVDEDMWDEPSPCEGWTGRHVLGHVIAMQHFYVASIEGRPPPMDPMTDPDRHAGRHPAAAWAEARDTVLEAIDRPDVLASVVRSPGGRSSVDTLIRFNVVDTTVHAWDLARATGVDDRLDVGLVERCLALVDEARAAEARGSLGPGFAAAVAEAHLDPQRRLLAATGRRP